MNYDDSYYTGEYPDSPYYMDDCLNDKLVSHAMVYDIENYMSTIDKSTIQTDDDIANLISDIQSKYGYSDYGFIYNLVMSRL